MISSRIVFIFFLVPLVYSADHESFKNCSRVPFCSTLRSRSPSDDYSLDPDSISYSADFNTLTAALVPNQGTADLKLELSGLLTSIFRVKITETQSTRYELKDVLDGEPQLKPFDDVQLDSTSVILTSDQHTITINFSPFNIVFTKEDIPEVVFNGDRLTLSQNDDTAPFSFGITFPQAVQLYGLHEHCETLALKTTAPDGTDPYRLKNSDVGGYEIESPMALYGSVPLLFGHGPEVTAGVFLHNAAEQWIETTNEDGTAYFMVETGTLDLFILMGSSPREVTRQYTYLTGTAPVPPLWTLGYHQSRFTYEDQEDVKFVARSFDENNFQLDAIWLDIDYTDGFRYFTWNPDTFSDPIDLQETIASTNKKLVTIIDPHVKAEPGYNVYDGAVAKDLFLKNPDGSLYQGAAWPGASCYLDFLNPEARQYYSSFFSYKNFPNTTSTIAGIWNDMNEPSVFDSSTEHTVPANTLQFMNLKHREVHNIYGFLHTMSTYQGLLDRDNGQLRPFILTRSHFAGSQRYTAIWTGDNQADWPYLLASFQECLNANIQGLVFCGSDVGGFFNNPSNELLERWYQGGAWLPFYRAHSEKSTQRREPYLLPEDSQVVIRNAIQTRYQHLPVWYTLFYEHYKTGDAVIRPLFWQYPQDVEVLSIDNEFLVGRDILVQAVTQPEVDSVDVYFPGGENEVWYWNDGTNVNVHNGTGWDSVPVTRDYIPLFYRVGGVLLRKDTVRPNTAEMVNDTYTLHCSTNSDGYANGTIYVDDGSTFKYKDSADFNYNSIEVNGNTYTFTSIDGDGDFEIVINLIVKTDIVHKNGVSSSSTVTTYTQTADGTMLKDLRIKLKETTIIKLK